MIHAKIIRTIDAVAINLLICSLVFVWLHYYLRSLTTCLFLSIAITAVIYVVYRIITDAKSDRKKLKADAEQTARKHMRSLILAPKQQTFDFLFQLISARNPKLLRKADCFLCEKTAYVPILQEESLTNRDVTSALQTALKYDAERLVILTTEFSVPVSDFAKSIAPVAVQVADYAALYELMQQQDSFPKEYVTLKKNKAGLKQILNYAFQRKRAKGYILTGLLLLASSFLTFYKLYYLISGSVLFLLALFCLVNRRFNAPADSDNLW